ncbi:anhydro-N-acetylmuramic acid kinase [Kistimonas asteriae]|uniref:anhydro-N-acetylmuramic acid kinase n=1 Tax=Kistimonas asteriae TaxID=517724 RepID=UPI001FE6AB69|nr:anhydro-N-acetylmuramic acid kinase [Kistimonas asteriae]
MTMQPTEPDSELYIGLMSGTSMDAMDAVLVDLASSFPLQKHQISIPLSETLRKSLLALCQEGPDEITRMAKADIQIAQISAQAVNMLLKEASVPASDIQAIGSHGQTIRHLPEFGNTLQIGSPSHIAEQTGILTVADFRRRDMAAGGQGAPLVPAFHEAVFQHAEKRRVILNIGGIANISILPTAQHIPVSGFDTGPGNALMDYWNQKHQGTRYDLNGNWATSGTVDHALLHDCLSDAYFSRQPPKSTGREHFNAEWLNSLLSKHSALAPADIQATLMELTAKSIAADIQRYAADCQELFVCGGGAYNSALLERIAFHLPDITVSSTRSLGLAAEWVEAVAFAWLARQTIHGLPGNLPSVTNAKGRRILGGIYPA